MKKNDVVTIEITDIASDACGVGRHEGMAVFVPVTAPGDVIDCRIVKVKKSLAYGIVDSIKTSSPLRQDNDCPSFPKCGGCGLRHISYEAECAAKEKWVRENMRRIAATSAQVLPIIHAPSPMRYRNKATYPIAATNGTPVAGFYAQRSHRVVEHGDCLLHPELFSLIREAVTVFLASRSISVYDEERHKGLVRNLFLRMGEATGEVMVCLVLNGGELPFSGEFVKELTEAFSQIKTIVINENKKRTNVTLGAKNHVLFGNGSIDDVLCGMRFTISPGSFYQINRAATELLYKKAGELCALNGRETLLDLYCGAGTIGLTMALAAKEVIGVEIVPAAVEDARRNAMQNGVTNARFICADADAAAAELAGEGVRPDVVVLDPPRRGVDPGLIDTVAGMSPARVVMVSCNSATAARDVALFEQRGFMAKVVQPLDMFPRSAHVECVVLMEKR